MKLLSNSNTNLGNPIDRENEKILAAAAKLESLKKEYETSVKLLEQAKADYELLMENLQKDVEAAADKLTDEDTVGELRKFLISSIINHGKGDRAV